MDRIIDWCLYQLGDIHWGYDSRIDCMRASSSCNSEKCIATNTSKNLQHHIKVNILEMYALLRLLLGLLVAEASRHVANNKGYLKVHLCDSEYVILLSLHAFAFSEISRNDVHITLGT